MKNNNGHQALMSCVVAEARGWLSGLKSFMSVALRRNVAIVFTGLMLVSTIQSGQNTSPSPTGNVPPSCDSTRALLLVQSQVEAVKDITNTAESIAILIRSADALWKFREDAARNIFTQAYELAEKNYREKSEASLKEKSKTSPEDHRFAVMQAISRHDSVWSQLLSKRVVEETRRTAQLGLEAAKLAQVGEGSNLANKLLNLASSILPIDQQAASDIARSSLLYAPSFTLGQFLFRLAASNRESADRLYQEAIKAYANSNARDLLLLSAYPFGTNRIVIGAQAVYLTVPPNFAPHPALQQMFLEALLHRTEVLINPSYEAIADANRESEPVQVYTALSILEPVIAQHQPNLLDRVATLKGMVKSALYPEARQRADNTVRMRLGAEDESFASYIEKAERATSSDRRDYLLVTALMKAPDDERLDRLKDFAQKISDSKIRQQLLNWLYFKRTQKAINEGYLDDARQLSEKVEQLDLRAYLSYEIAAESLKRFEDRTRVREILDAVAAAALKTDNTNEKARTLLGISHLYSKIDHIRAFEVMTDAVKTINRITDPDLNSTGLSQRIEGPQFGYLARYDVAGFSLENAFRELAPSDFDRALLLAKTLEDKTLRSTAIITLADFCLEMAQKQQSQPSQTGKKPKGQKTSDQRRKPNL